MTPETPETRADAIAKGIQYTAEDDQAASDERDAAKELGIRLTAEDNAATPEGVRISASAQHAKLRGLTAAFLTVLAVALVGVMVGVGYMAYQSNAQAQQNYQLIQRVESLNERVVDCTEVGGECFEDGQRRTAKAVVGINEGTLRVIVAALSCQESGITGQRALSRCTVRRATAAQPKP